MSVGGALNAPSGGWRRDRGLSTVSSMLVIVVVLALLGVGTYAVMGGFTSSGPTTTCAPITALACGKFVNPHDLTLLLPFLSVQQGQTVPFTAKVPAGESASSFTFNFGDGHSPLVSHSPSVSYNYSTPGVYLVYLQASVNGLTHDNLPALLRVTVTPSFAANTAGDLPGVTGTLVANSTAPAGTKGVTAVLSVGQSITLQGAYSSAPTNPAFTTAAPKFVAASGVSLSSASATNVSAQTTATFSQPGVFDVTFVGSATSGNSTVYQNYTWTAFVAAPGMRGGVQGNTIVHSPHPGTIINYELAPGGAFSEDPAIDYETVGYEPILNVYQTLITYNGSRAGPDWTNFVPVLATCVPGSPQCTNLYGSSLQNGWNYTFVIQANASFYDPSTGVSWGVWPSDVLFSMMRTMGFSTLPCVTCNNGWILTQALLSPGNTTWNPIHGAYNNTPQNMLGAISVNDSSCPPLALSRDHGCVTFHADGAGHAWPYFLELIADGLGGSVVPCGWFSAPNQAAGIPYWTQGNVSGSGDHPCQLPGAPGYGLPASQIPVTGWDGWEQLGSGVFGTYQGHVQYAMAGSGPYYLAQYSVGTSYTLEANPGYGQNPYCTWSGCQPAPGAYAHMVEVTWETTPIPGETAYAAGVADHATIPTQDLGLLLQLISEGKVNAISAPTLTIGFYPFNMNFNQGGAQRFTTSPITIPNDWFAYVGMREFFARAYPYTTVQQTILTKNGIQLGFGYGGAIPQFMANFYPRGIPWPNTDPCTNATNVACPTYWWDQMHQPSSIYYDPEVSACTPANPCELPLFGETGSATNDQVMALWASEVAALSGGAVKVSPVDINFVDLIINSEFSPPGSNSMPFYTLGWAPDYPDPTDYVVPLYTANATYTYGDAVMQSLYVPRFTTGCSHNASDYVYWSNVTIPQSCQGTAYKAMLKALAVAANLPNGPARVETYAQAEQIAYQLCLYTYTSQANQVSSVAAWMDTSSINTNVTIGGGGDVPYFWLTGNGVASPTST